MPQLFHKRFEIDISSNEGRRRVRNRIRNSTLELLQMLSKRGTSHNTLLNALNTKLGEAHVTIQADNEFSFMKVWDGLVKNNFWKFLRVTEAFHAVLTESVGKGSAAYFEKIIRSALASSEIDLEIRWDDGVFIKAGARLLDERLVNDPLRWLRNANHENVLKAFEKGLKYWMEVHKDKERCGDVVTNMYEALEALA